MYQYIHVFYIFPPQDSKWKKRQRVLSSNVRCVAYVFVPQLGMFFDEITHELSTSGVRKHDDLDASASKKVFFADERVVLADYDARDAVKKYGAGTHAARAESGVLLFLLVSFRV